MYAIRSYYAFLALDAIGATLMMNWGFVNAAWALGLVALVILLTGLPISYYAARHGIDMDLLTRGAGFGYIGSTITSLIYASFTRITSYNVCYTKLLRRAIASCCC